MEKNFKLGVIGAGFMSSAIVKGVLKSGILTKEEIIVSDIADEFLGKAKALCVNTTTDNVYLANNSEFVLFAVKPQSLADVLFAIKGCNCKKFISIMAGVKIEKIKANFDGAQVARCMPNTPCSLGLGAIGVDAEDYSNEADKTFIKDVLSSCGEVVFTQEKNINAVTGISGSSPAYFYYFIRSLINAGVKAGLDFEDAKKLAVATMIGSGQMIRENSEKSLDDLITAVCSKGGTTIQAIKVFDNQNLDKTVNDAVTACIKRAEELESM